ncbi:hypothetical protein V8G54_019119 [Vigna mungo]|uniref:Uncharacterized protein n=1 Tax=Vigna mungo TaxID=3915 RepID=A0AAQ3NC25_VIGMU
MNCNILEGSTKNKYELIGLFGDVSNESIHFCGSNCTFIHVPMNGIFKPHCSLSHLITFLRFNQPSHSILNNRSTNNHIPFGPILHNQTNLEHLCHQNSVSWLVRMHRPCCYWLPCG